VTAIRAIDHVQLAMPPGEEDKARSFFVGVLGTREVPRPPGLANRGGAWFEAGSVNIDVGVEADFRPARKAHAALTVAGSAELRNRLATAGYPIREDNDIKGVKRFFTDDAFCNRLEFIEETP